MTLSKYSLSFGIPYNLICTTFFAYYNWTFFWTFFTQISWRNPQLGVKGLCNGGGKVKPW